MEDLLKAQIATRVRAGCFVVRDDSVLLMHRQPW
jgi:hypothetical protein